MGADDCGAACKINTIISNLWPGQVPAVSGLLLPSLLSATPFAVRGVGAVGCRGDRGGDGGELGGGDGDGSGGEVGGGIGEKGLGAAWCGQGG